MNSTTPAPFTSTLRRAALPGHARTLQLLTVAATPRTSHRSRPRLRTEEELFGASVPCGGCSQDTPEMFLKSGLCPECDGTAGFMARHGHPLS